MHGQGYGIVADDMVMVSGQRVFSGPRCIHLRDEAAAALGGRPLGGDRRGKWRVDLPPAEPDYQLGGWVVLRWADEVRIRRLPLTARLAALGSHRVWGRLRPDPSRWLDIGARPAWELSRPRRWSSLERAACPNPLLPPRRPTNSASGRSANEDGEKAGDCAGSTRAGLPAGGRG